MAEGGEENKKITIRIKTSKQVKDVEIEANATIQRLQALASETFGIDEGKRMFFIFAGKKLKDDSSLEFYKINNGAVVHFFVRDTTDETNVHDAPIVQSDPSPYVPPGPIGGGGPSERFLDTVMQTPRMQEIFANNPMVSQALNNRSSMRRAFDVARNPAAAEELRRSHDRALSNLESLPGGFNALARLYREIQEPLQEATSDTLQNIRNNLRGSLGGAQPANATAAVGSGVNPQLGTENCEPLPNPWAQPTPLSSNNISNSIRQLAPALMNLNISPNQGNGQGGGTLAAATLANINAQLSATLNATLNATGGGGVGGTNSVGNNNNGNAIPLTASTVRNLRSELFSMVTSSMNATAAAGSGGTASLGGLSALGGGVGGGGTNATNNVAPEVRFANELAQLEAMGFGDRDANLQALTETSGNLNAAIDRLLAFNAARFG